MDLQTISQVSRTFNISTRTLRYYEQIGLLKSTKKAEYAYRTYDEASIERLRQIIVLRKLRIPLKQISHILQTKDANLAIKVFQNKLKEIEDEITSLSTVKTILNTFIGQLNNSLSLKVKLSLLNDESMLKIVDALSVTKNNFEEEKSMRDLNKANVNLSELKDVRIVYLPPSTVLASHFIGENPEERSAIPLDQFVKETNLCKTKPDLRQYGFNYPNPSDGHPYGYERWVTIPDEMEIPKQFAKKYFKGGLYAAHMIPIGAFEEWGWLFKWVEQSDKYEVNPGDPECMSGCLEEHLNYVNYVRRPVNELYDLQLDLLIPIKEKL